jgi:hypothetical protein
LKQSAIKKEANKMSEIQPIPKRNFIARIFISSDEPRLRAGWRLLLQTLLMVIIAVILQSVLSMFFIPGKNGNLDLFISQVGVVFGFPVSGLDMYHLIRLQIQGPEIWTGGAFGPEAGLINLPALGIGAVLIYLYTRERTIVKEIR